MAIPEPVLAMLRPYQPALAPWPAWSPPGYRWAYVAYASPARGYSQEFQLTLEAPVVCPCPTARCPECVEWFQVGMVRNARTGETIVGDQTSCCGWECGRGSRCVSRLRVRRGDRLIITVKLFDRCDRLITNWTRTITLRWHRRDCTFVGRPGGEEIARTGPFTIRTNVGPDVAAFEVEIPPIVFDFMEATPDNPNVRFHIAIEG